MSEPTATEPLGWPVRSSRESSPRTPTTPRRWLSVSNLLDDEGAAFRNGNTVTMDGFVAAGLRMIQCDYPALMDEYLRDKGKR